MFLKRSAKVLVSTIRIDSVESLSSINPSNTCLLSGISDISVSTSVSPSRFEDGYNTLDSQTNRGVYVEPGNDVNYSIGIQAALGTSANTVNNKILWSGLLTTDLSTSFNTTSNVLNNAQSGQSLKELSIVILTESFCVAYNRVVVNSLDLPFAIGGLVYCSWSFLAGNLIELQNINLSDSTLSVNGSLYTVYTETIDSYISGKIMKADLNITGDLISLAALSGGLNISNNISLVPNTAIDGFNSFIGYKLGALKLQGNIRVYLKVGLVKDKINSLIAEYTSGEKYISTELVLSFPTPTKTVVIELGKVFITMPQISYDNVLSYDIKYDVANYYNNTFNLYVE
jgi:hypothetical protein